MKKLFILSFAMVCMFISNHASIAQKAAYPGSLLITEIMVNPAQVSDTKGEWFEVYNLSFDTLTLEGMVIKDLGANRYSVATDPAFVLMPGEVVLFVRDMDPDVNGGLQGKMLTGSFSLGNTDDEIILTTESGEIIDQISYNPDWPIEAGASMELKSDYLSSTGHNQPEKWNSATQTYGNGDLGTPGQVGIVAFKPYLQDESLSVDVYPNPCHESFMLEAIFDSPTSGEIHLINVAGQSIVKEPFGPTMSLRRYYRPELMEFGVYFLVIQGNQRSTVHRLIVY